MYMLIGAAQTSSLAKVHTKGNHMECKKAPLLLLVEDNGGTMYVMSS